MSKVVESAKAMMPELIAIRRHFHMYPENSRCEKETSAKVIELLKEMGVDEIIENVNGYGVIVFYVANRERATKRSPACFCRRNGRGGIAGFHRNRCLRTKLSVDSTNVHVNRLDGFILFQFVINGFVL